MSSWFCLNGCPDVLKPETRTRGTTERTLAWGGGEETTGIILVHVPYYGGACEAARARVCVCMCGSGVHLNSRFDALARTHRLGISRIPAALRKVALPSSTHSRLCLERLPGNHLDGAQQCVC